MDRSVLVFLVFILPIFSIAQEKEKTSSQPQLRNEIGLNLFTYKLQDDNGVTFGGDEKLKLNYVPGLYYKYHFGYNAIRGYYGYSQKTFVQILTFNSNGFGGYGDWIIKETFREHEFKAGYERSFGNCKLKPYILTDLVFQYINMQGEQTSSFNGNPPVTGSFRSEVFNLGISAGAGLRYTISKRVRISYEGSMMLYFSKIGNSNISLTDGFTPGLAYGPVSLFGLSILY